MPKIGKLDVRTCPAWFVQVAEEMVRNNTSLKEAALDLGIKLEPDEVEKIGRRKDFQEIVRVERNKYEAAVANDPTRTKAVAIGKMWLLAERLEREGEHEKAAVVVEKIGKLEGWTGGEHNVNIFSGLSARDIAEAKQRLAGAQLERSKGIVAEPRKGESLPN